MDAFSLQGKTALITGGSGGVGITTAKHLLRSGASVALIDRNLESLGPVADKLVQWFKTTAEYETYLPKTEDDAPQEIPIISTWACDISDAVSVETMVQSIRAHHEKPLNILVNCAGYCENFTALDYPAANLASIINTNLLGAFFICQSVARSLIADKAKGSLVLIASMSAHIVNNPQPQVGYNMAKAGVIHMARTLAAEWAPLGIRVNTLSPGYIATPLTKAIIEKDTKLRDEWSSKVPMGRISEPEEMTGAIVFMASDASSYMTGSDIVVDGGYTVW
ncbi:NAD(P)-binding protein [Nadsonia fulvescens var. elongata DSM 6958]|uniref:D-arabinitol 2-dehydrogenase [ribulose-forming] n=1 Tax=Nadsonia fulvescens var. elongata DSM 6958 TaxID=857566 RepID=A0A1E3PQI7_9ASCO|nr:NAD(P)-binding protein [Nadsonia fulvescens var. elongata DSM 6958]